MKTMQFLVMNHYPNAYHILSKAPRTPFEIQLESRTVPVCTQPYSKYSPSLTRNPGQSHSVMKSALLPGCAQLLDFNHMTPFDSTL